MDYKQRDLVWLNHPIPLPDGTNLAHPILIISCDNANRENSYTGVMMSSTAKQDRFSFELNNEMFESPLAKADCQFRTYILISFKKGDIKSFFNRMKKPHFKPLIDQIKEFVFCID